MSFATHAASRPRLIPQSQPLAGQIENNAGGFVYSVDPMTQAERFLILGSSGGTYYATERDVTKENASVIRKLSSDATSGPELVSMIVDISKSGRAPKNDPAIFALALCFGPQAASETKRAAEGAVSDVCRTGTHILFFVHCINLTRGWGRAARRAVADWYANQEPEKLAFQVLKYRNRHGFTHRDALRLAHPKASTAEHQAIYKYVARTEKDLAGIDGLDLIRYDGEYASMTDAELLSAISTLGLQMEFVPSDRRTAAVYELMIRTYGNTALLRNLGNLSKSGALDDPDNIRTVVDRIETGLAKDKFVHPLSILIGMKTYSSGHGLRGSASWVPSQPIVDALDTAFYKSFDYVEPCGKNLMVALDISGSMSSPIAGTNVSCIEAAVALAALDVKIERMPLVLGFNTGRSYFGHDKNPTMVTLPISPKRRLDDMVNESMRLWGHGGTDCSLPMLLAIQDKRAVDAFVVYTDNETWAGGIHPSEALRRYRATSGINAKLVVVGMTSTGFSIADPNDAGMLDVVGFDTAAPQVIRDFISK